MPQAEIKSRDKTLTENFAEFMVSRGMDPRKASSVARKAAGSLFTPDVEAAEGAVDVASRQAAGEDVSVLEGTGSWFNALVGLVPGAGIIKKAGKKALKATAGKKVVSFEKLFGRPEKLPPGVQKGQLAEDVDILDHARVDKRLAAAEKERKVGTFKAAQVKQAMPRKDRIAIMQVANTPASSPVRQEAAESIARSAQKLGYELKPSKAQQGWVSVWKEGKEVHSASGLDKAVRYVADDLAELLK